MRRQNVVFRGLFESLVNCDFTLLLLTNKLFNQNICNNDCHQNKYFFIVYFNAQVPRAANVIIITFLRILNTLDNEMKKTN